MCRKFWMFVSQFPIFNCADPDPNSEYGSQSAASLLQISNWFIPGHCCIKVTLHMFCYLRILFWPYWQDESGPQMCGSLFPFREDIFWQRQQWPIVITMNTGPVVTFESSTDNQWGLSPWNAIFAERGVQRRSCQKFVVSKIVCYVIIKLKSNGSSFTIRIAEWQLSK